MHEKMLDPRDHYVELDALRGLAILGVVISHIAGYWELFIGAPLLLPGLGVDARNLALTTGAYGVALFFLLSGYLLSWTEGKRVKAGTFSARSYGLRRVLRLVPAYYVALLLGVLLWPTPVSVSDVLWHASFLHALNFETLNNMDTVFWSLTPEVVFYCLLPLILLKLPRLSHRLALLGVFLLVSAAVRVYVVWATPMLAVSVWYNAFFTVIAPYIFVAGVLLRMLVEHLEERGAPRAHRRLASIILVASVAALVAMPYSLLTETLPLYPISSSWVLALMVVDLAVAAFFASALLGAPLLRRVLRWRPLAFVGVISYSLFLLHGLILRQSVPFLLEIGQWVASRGGVTVWAIFAAYATIIFGIAVPIAYLSYRYIESPFLRRRVK